MRPDRVIRHDVEEELHADPALDAADIAVAVQDGVVFLSGFVRFYRHKLHAEMAAKRVAGVTAVADDIDVRLPLLHQRPDPLIARDAVEALERVLPDAAPHIQVTVRNGWVTLEGEVEWNHEREEAKWQVVPVRGVIGVSNKIRLRPKVAPEEIETAVAAAIRRSAQLDAERIAVEVDGDGVRLRGTVRSWAEKEEAERAAWSLPGIAWVYNQLAVSL
jgi:osmotically-inducible protein OsmY